MNQQELDLKLVEEAEKYLHDPLGFVMFAFPWGEGPLRGYTGPDTWQADYLARLGRETAKRGFDGRIPVLPIRMATASGRGIGKTTLTAWVVCWILCTRPHSKGTVTANSWTQLRDRTWAGIQYWLKLSLFRDWFVITSDKIHFRSNKESWYVAAQSSKPENAEAFGGQHSAGSTSFIVCDEASAIDDKIFAICEGNLSDGEGMFFMFGNPTRTEGAFHRAVFGSERERWIHASIDSRDCALPNKQQIAEWESAYGEDSDWFRINVKGECPRSGSSQLIASDVVAACRKFKATGYEELPKIISCDVARFGDDRTVIGLRQGRHFSFLGKFSGIDTVQTAERLIEFINEEKPSAVIVDGDGIGGAVCDQLKFRNYSRNLHEFRGGIPAHDASRYFNRRAEVWGLMNDALKGGMQIPDDPELEVDLTSPQYFLSNKSQIQLERKQDMKSRGLASPDLGDALAYSFAVTMAAPYVADEESYWDKMARAQYENNLVLGKEDLRWMS